MNVTYWLLIPLLALAEARALGQSNLTSERLFNRERPPAYRDAVVKRMLAEINDYAIRLDLAEPRPIYTNALTELFVSSPSVAERFGAFGSMRTTNFSYAFGRGGHLCYITRMIKGDNPYSYEDNKPFAIDPSLANTNMAYNLATQLLSRVFVDVSRLSTSSVVSIQPWVIIHMTTSKYTVQWERAGSPIVKVVLSFPPTTLWTLRVEDPDLIIHPPLKFKDFEPLLPKTKTMHPP